MLDVGPGDAELFGLLQGKHGPLHDGEPFVVTPAHQRAEGLFRDQVRQDQVVVGAGRFLVADAGQARGIRRVGLATAAEQRLEGGLEAVEHHRLDVELVGAREVGQVLLVGGAGLHAHLGVLELLGLRDLVLLVDQKALAVEEGDGGEVEAQRGIAAQRPRGVARQQVHLAGFQGGEALLGVERHVAHLVGIAQGGSSHGPADVHVQSLPLALGIGCRKAGHPGADPTQDLTALLEGAQGLARAGEPGPQGGTQEQGRREPLAKEKMRHGLSIKDEANSPQQDAGRGAPELASRRELGSSGEPIPC